MVSAQKRELDLSMVPVRIPDFDNAQRGMLAAPAERPPVERLPEDIQFEKGREERGTGRLPDANRLPEDIETTRQNRPSPERLPEDLPEAHREERGSGRRPDAERLPEDIPAQKAAPREKGSSGGSFDVLDEETRSAPKQVGEKKKKGGDEDFLF